MCVVDDLLEHSEAGRAKYGAQLLPVLMEAVTSDHADLRQCSVYGLGILAAKVSARRRWRTGSRMGKDVCGGTEGGGDLPEGTASCLLLVPVALAF